MSGPVTDREREWLRDVRRRTRPVGATVAEMQERCRQSIAAHLRPPVPRDATHETVCHRRIHVFLLGELAE
jgi:hypothetical protein